MRARALGWVLAAGAALVLAGACAQIEGLAAYEKVDCLDGGSCAPVAPLACSGDLADCGEGVCTDLRTTASHCGACGSACTGNQACCARGCTDTTQDPKNCGGCGTACSGTQSCVGGHCVEADAGEPPVPVGGPLVVTGTLTINRVRSGGVVGATGEASITVATTTGFAVGDPIVIHQSRGKNAGIFEGTEIVAIEGNALKLKAPLVNTYASSGADAAQVVRVDVFTTVTVTPTGTLRAAPWDGASGGLLLLRSASDIVVAGSVDMTGAGFRGGSHAAQCASGSAYRCQVAPNTDPAGAPFLSTQAANGTAGESPTGPGAVGFQNNGAGGGGGESGDCVGGGGGGYGGGGNNGTGGPAAAAPCWLDNPHGGGGGGGSGAADLSTNLLFGGAGGEGGGDDQGAYPGAGGNGGGVIVLSALSLTVTGHVVTNGSVGGASMATAAGCGGAVCGMGPGGGGAGGAIFVGITGKVDLGANLVIAAGGAGGKCDCTDGKPGGNGASGRIFVSGATVTGSTQPGYAVPPPPPAGG
jgi:hypothetical protein